MKQDGNSNTGSNYNTPLIKSTPIKNIEPKKLL